LSEDVMSNTLVWFALNPRW